MTDIEVLRGRLRDYADGLGAPPVILHDVGELVTLLREADAEIEALRADVEAWKASHTMLTDTCHHFQARAARLAEALQAVVDALGHPLPVMSAGHVYLPERVIRPALDAARAALRDHDKEDEK